MAPRPDVYIPSSPSSSGKIMGINRWVFIGALAVGGYLAYRYFKNRSSSSATAPTVTGPACSDQSTPDPVSGLCANGLYPGQTTPFPGQAGTPSSGGGGTSGGGGGGGTGPPTTTPPPTSSGQGSWVWLINPDLCGNQFGGCWLYRTSAGADGSCSSGQPNPYHPNSGYCFSSSSSDGSNPPTSQATQAGQSPLSTNTLGTSVTTPQAGINQQNGPPDWRSVLLGAQTSGILGSDHTLVTPPSNPGLPQPEAAPASSRHVILGSADDHHLYLAQQNAMNRPPPPTGARNWFGPPPKNVHHGQHWEGPPERPPSGFPPLPKPGNVPPGVS